MTPRHNDWLDKPLLDIVSYARPGPAIRDRLSPEHIEAIRRTVRRTPEVMIKVLTHGGRDAAAVQRHLYYIARSGDLDLEGDDGEPLQGKEAIKTLIDDWDLDLENDRQESALRAAPGRMSRRLVHKLIFSMPRGTPPKKVLAAVQASARIKFEQHRYAMALHTDEPHPHVHVVVKAVSERGERLNIQKATLREWRSEFAKQLRKLGVAANATERAVRGQDRSAKKDGIYRAASRGESTFMRKRVSQLVLELNEGSLQPELNKRKLVSTRRVIVDAWRSLSERVAKEGHTRLARTIHVFAAKMPPARTDKEQLLQSLRQHVPPAPTMEAEAP